MCVDVNMNAFGTYNFQSMNPFYLKVAHFLSALNHNPIQKPVQTCDYLQNIKKAKTNPKSFGIID